MHTTTPKKDKNAPTILKIDLSKVKTGLVLTARGGQMRDRRTARNRTRSQQNRTALAGW